MKGNVNRPLLYPEVCVLTVKLCNRRLKKRYSSNPFLCLKELVNCEFYSRKWIFVFLSESIKLLSFGSYPGKQARLII